MLQGSLGDIVGAAPIQLLEPQKSRPQEPTLSWQASGTAPALSAAYIKATPTFPTEISERGISAYAQATSFFISPGCELLRSFPIDLGLLSQFTAYPILLPGVGRASLQQHKGMAGGSTDTRDEGNPPGPSMATAEPSAGKGVQDRRLYGPS